MKLALTLTLRHCVQLVCVSPQRLVPGKLFICKWRLWDCMRAHLMTGGDRWAAKSLLNPHKNWHFQSVTLISWETTVFSLWLIKMLPPSTKFMLVLIRDAKCSVRSTSAGIWCGPHPEDRRQTFPQVTFVLTAAEISLKIRFDAIHRLASVYVLFIYLSTLYRAPTSCLPSCPPEDAL